jgi:hypothetical protein
VDGLALEFRGRTLGDDPVVGILGGLLLVVEQSWGVEVLAESGGVGRDMIVSCVMCGGCDGCVLDGEDDD